MIHNPDITMKILMGYLKSYFPNYQIPKLMKAPNCLPMRQTGWGVHGVRPHLREEDLQL